MALDPQHWTLKTQEALTEAQRLAEAARNAEVTPAHAASGASSSGSSFAAVLNGVDAHEVQAKPKGHKSDGAATFSSRASRGKMNASRPSASMIRSDASTAASRLISGLAGRGMTLLSRQRLL